ncbi:hypothetical protein BH11PAT4_BH11PAT4_1450 [soil metagenome]
MGLISAKTSNRIIRFLKSDNASRITGWFLLPVGSLGLLSDLQVYGGINVAYGVLTAIALWLIVRAAGIWDVSDSRELMLRHASGKHHAKHVHHAPKVQLINKQQVRYIIAGLLLLGVAFLVIGINQLFAASPSMFLLLVEGLAIVTMLLAGSKRRGWFLIASSTAAATLLSSITYLMPAGAYSDERLLSSYLAIAYVAVTFWVVSRWRRTLESNRMGIVLIFATSLTYICLVSYLADYAFHAAFQVALLSLAGISMAYATSAWIQVARQSFAKFFLLVAIGSAMFWAYLYLNETAVILMLMVIGLVSLLTGFLSASYTGRMLGLAAVSLACLHFLLMLQGSVYSVFGPIWQHTSVWLGALVVTALGMVYWWYGAWLPTLKPRETLLQPIIRRALATFAWGILLILFVQEATGLTQTILFAVWGIWLYILSKRYHEPLGIIAGSAGLLLAGFQFLAVDLPHLSTLEQAVGFIVFAILVFSGSVYVAQHYLSHKKSHS